MHPDMEAKRDYTQSASEKKAQANGCMMSKVTEKQSTRSTTSLVISTNVTKWSRVGAKMKTNSIFFILQESSYFSCIMPKMIRNSQIKAASLLNTRIRMSF